ncbi:hypothetical protein SAMN05216330_11945 [Bradyrhizobium sp. Ghvi]|nr:hypothetical protein SAMN05216330_11945 [Bradyrhizobium sp. Ghvi]
MHRKQWQHARECRHGQGLMTPADRRRPQWSWLSSRRPLLSVRTAGTCTRRCTACCSSLAAWPAASLAARTSHRLELVGPSCQSRWASSNAEHSASGLVSAIATFARAILEAQFSSLERRLRSCTPHGVADPDNAALQDLAIQPTAIDQVFGDCLAGEFFDMPTGIHKLGPFQHCLAEPEPPAHQMV